MSRHRRQRHLMFSAKALGAAVCVFSPSITGVNDGDPLSTWYDLSGNSRDLTASGSARPTYDAVTSNGFAAVVFNGTTNYLQYASGIGQTGDVQVTCVAAMKADDLSNINAVFGFGDAMSPLQAFGLLLNVQAAGDWSNQYAGGNPAKFQSANGQPLVVSTAKSSGAINSTSQLRQNGAAQSVQSGSSSNTPNIASGNLSLGIWANYTSEFYFVGSVFSFLIINSVISNHLLKRIENALGLTFRIAQS